MEEGLVKVLLDQDDRAKNFCPIMFLLDHMIDNRPYKLPCDVNPIVTNITIHCFNIFFNSLVTYFTKCFLFDLFGTNHKTEEKKSKT